MARLRAISCVSAANVVGMDEVTDFLVGLARPSARSRLTEALTGARNRTRHSVLPLAALARLGGIGERSELYRQHATELAMRAVARLAERGQLDTRAISKVIFVSGTGQATPSIETEIIRRFGLDPRCRRIPLSQLGCAGGVAALALAAETVRERGGATLVVSAEVPSLQLQLAEPSFAELLAAAHFGDGAAAAVIAADGPGVEICATASTLLPEVAEGGQVLVHETGLRLRSSGDLSGLIRRRVEPLLRELTTEHGLEPRELAFVAAHPRSARVLESVADGLRLDDEQLAGSWATWEKRANMISSGVFCALDESARGAAPDGARAAALLAFGAGTSCEIALLRWAEAGELTGIAERAA